MSSSERAPTTGFPGGPEISSPAGAEVPLVVDLDGTLTKTDLLAESACRLLQRNPLYVFMLLFWLLKGRHVLKQEVSGRIHIDPGVLPGNQAFLAFLRSSHAQGRRLVLATAASESSARTVGEFHGIFDEVLSSDGTRNLDRERKRRALVGRFGEGGYDYAGNGHADLPAWRSARKAIVVNAPQGVLRRATSLGNVDRVFPRERTVLSAWVRSLRLHQWLKNLLVLVPLVAARRWTDADAMSDALVLLGAFCLTASAVYQLNDIVDLDHDRVHENKRRRPMASGDLSLQLGALTAFSFLVCGFALAYALSGAVLAVVAIYVTLTFSYSLALKSHAIVDVVTLAGLYTVRIVGGAVAIGVVTSYWLLTFSMFLFLSLAVLKRCAELNRNAVRGEAGAPGRGYRTDDLPVLTSLGTALSAAATVILALYINDGARAQYSRPEILWLLCPLMVYWIGRMWIKTGRGEMHDDPIVFALRDKPSLAAAGIGLALVIVAGL